MSRETAIAIARNTLDELRTYSYAELSRRVGTSFNEEIRGADSKDYQAEAEIRWDDPSEKRNVRAFASVDGGGVSSLRPALASFILAPDGSFVGDADEAS